MRGFGERKPLKLHTTRPNRRITRGQKGPSSHDVSGFISFYRSWVKSVAMFTLSVVAVKVYVDGEVDPSHIAN